MIAEPTTTVTALPSQSPDDSERKLSLHRIAAVLQVVLATRRAARNDDHAHRYAVPRGM